MYLICLHQQLYFFHFMLLKHAIYMPPSPVHLICIGPTPLLNAFMHPTLVINTHTLHQSLTYSFPSTGDPYSLHKLFTYSFASVCANNREIIMWACLWVWVWCVCVCQFCVYQRLKARTVKKAIYPLFLRYCVPCLSPLVAHHFGKHCVAPIAPVKWHKPDAMLLRLGVRESSGWAGDTHSHSAAVSESQSTEHTPNTLMEMLCLLCRKGPFQEIGTKQKK